MRRILSTLAVLCLTAPALWAGPVVVSQLKGHVERRLPGSTDWSPVEIGDRLPEGTVVLTGEKATISLDFDQGHFLRVAPKSQVVLTTLQATKTKTFLTQGKVLSKVRPLKGSEDFLIQTPSAVCAVRGTEFWTGSNEKGTAVQVSHGAVGMMANGTNTELMVRAGQTASILTDGTIIPPHNAAPESKKSESDSNLAREARHEVGLDMTREQVMAAAAAEIRLAEYREGKSLIDVHGNRVRLEEYIVRPAPDQFKFVVLNERDERLDYFYYSGVFNKPLPADLSVALRDMSGTFGSTAPEYFLKSYERGQSNTQDSSLDTASGGHLVNITVDSNGDYVLTDVENPSNTRTVPKSELESGSVDTYKVYNPVTDTFLTGVTEDQLETVTQISLFNTQNQTYQNLASGDSFWKTRFNTYSHALNGNSKINYVKSGATDVLASALDANWTYAGGTVYTEVTNDPLNVSSIITNTYGDGTQEKFRVWLIDNEGQIASQKSFEGISTGAAYRNELLKWNYQQEITATEFEGRKIDLVVEPKIFIDSGLIQ